MPRLLKLFLLQEVQKPIIWHLRSAVRDLGVTKIITSKIEHHAVLHTALQIKKEYGFEVKFVNLSDNGQIDYRSS